MKASGFTQEHIDDISTTKSIHWQHEREIRAAASLADAERERDLYFSTVDIRGVVLGALSRITESDIRKALPAVKQVRVTQARLGFGSYNVVRRKDRPVTIVTGATPTGNA
jgi:hypothetical protein